MVWFTPDWGVEMKPKDSILREVGALTRTIHAIIEITFKNLNLQKGQSIYLTRIVEHPGISIKELCTLLMVDKSTASKVITKLVSLGLVRKTQGRYDKRSMPLYPTAKAVKVYDSIIEEENRLTCLCYNGFNSEQKASVLLLIKQMRQNIEEDWYALKQYKTLPDKKDG
jgi:DNA-binding MarR family transcriptional regulator